MSESETSSNVHLEDKTFIKDGTNGVCKSASLQEPKKCEKYMAAGVSEQWAREKAYEKPCGRLKAYFSTPTRNSWKQPYNWKRMILIRITNKRFVLKTNLSNGPFIYVSILYYKTLLKMVEMGHSPRYWSSKRRLNARSCSSTLEIEVCCRKL